MNVPCFDSLFQRPLVIVSHTHKTPLFPTQLDQVSYIETFRLQGYQFQVLLKSYAFMTKPTEISLDKSVFVQWYESVKATRKKKRVRECSEREKKLRSLFIKQAQ